MARETKLNRVQSKAARLQRIEQRLYNAPQGLRATELAEDLAVNRRTIYRDLEALHDAGVPVWENGGRFGINRSAYLSTIRLTLHEAIALLFAARLLAHHSDERNPHIITALDKLAAGLPDETIAAHVVRVADIVRSRPVRRQYVEVLEALTLAWSDRRLVRLRYRAANRAVTERDIAPYFLEVSRSEPATYVIGFDRLRGAIRTFKVERIEAVTALDEQYAIPADFDPYRYLASAWGVIDDAAVEVRLRFSATAAARVRESVWHQSQRISDYPDGGCELAMTVGGIREIRAWVLSWGAEVEVLAPAELRAEVAAEAMRLAALYS